MTKDPLTFAELREINAKRSDEAFPQCRTWTTSDWAVAMAGEAGEICNAVKKLNRGDGNVEAIAKEIADTVLYCDLLAHRLGIDLGATIRSKFNEVSTRIGSPIRFEEES